MTYGTVFPSSNFNRTGVFHQTLILYALRLGVRLVRIFMCCCMFGVSVILDLGLSLVQSSKEHSGSLIEQQLLHLHICTGTRQHSTFGSHLLKPGATLTLRKVTLPRSASCSHVVWQGKPQSYAFYCLIQDIVNGNGQFSGSGSLLQGLWVALI